MKTHESAPRSAMSHRCWAPVVDDSVDSCDSLAAVIRMLGHDTAVAYDSREAVRIAAEFRPDHHPDGPVAPDHERT